MSRTASSLFTACDIPRVAKRKMEPADRLRGRAEDFHNPRMSSVESARLRRTYQLRFSKAFIVDFRVADASAFCS